LTQRDHVRSPQKAEPGTECTPPPANAKEGDTPRAPPFPLRGLGKRSPAPPSPAGDATRDVVTEYDLPAEMSGTGEINDGTVHVHAVMAVEGDRAVSGHLHRAQIGTWFARAYVIEITG